MEIFLDADFSPFSPSLDCSQSKDFSGSVYGKSSFITKMFPTRCIAATQRLCEGQGNLSLAGAAVRNSLGTTEEDWEGLGEQRR